MKSATITTKTKGTKLSAELKTIRIADIDTPTLPWWCWWSDKLSILFEPHHCWQTYSHFLLFSIYL